MKLDNIKSTFIRKRNNNYNVIVEYYDEAGKIKQKRRALYYGKEIIISKFDGGNFAAAAAGSRTAIDADQP